MKKTCNNCKAMNFNRCSLGYKTDFKSLLLDRKFIREYYPKEVCPKPRTSKEYMELLNSQGLVKLG